WHQRAISPDSKEVAEAMKPYYLWCIEHFGVERCMFESNFPVDKISYSYSTMWNAFKRVTENFSEQERNALFHDTAAKFYRL
ncbi:MAG: amidohydrolase family protein, partial [Chloroflexota bacterium]